MIRVFEPVVAVVFLASVFVMSNNPVFGQDVKRTRNSKPIPTFENVSYGDHKRNVIDFWQARSEIPTPVFVWIHGGGFRAGDKSSIPTPLLVSFIESGISCASINYRLTQHAPYPAQMKDSARAIQFLRSKKQQWNIAPEHFAAGGGSAGSGISQWLAFHEDLARPDSADVVAQQSTRLSCALPLNMQSTYDPRKIKEIIPGKAYRHPALLPFYDRPAGWDWDVDKIDVELDALIKDASPITHLTKDDPPIFLFHYKRSERPGDIHHPNFGKHLHGAMENLGIECVRKLDSDFASSRKAYEAMVAFVKKHLK